MKPTSHYVLQMPQPTGDKEVYAVCII